MEIKLDDSAVSKINNLSDDEFDNFIRRLSTRRSMYLREKNRDAEFRKLIQRLCVDVPVTWPVKFKWDTEKENGVRISVRISTPEENNDEPPKCIIELMYFDVEDTNATQVVIPHVILTIGYHNFGALRGVLPSITVTYVKDIHTDHTYEMSESFIDRVMHCSSLDDVVFDIARRFIIDPNYHIL